MSSFILAISGSPSKRSSSSQLADHVLDLCVQEGDIRTAHLRLSELDPKSLMSADQDDPGIRKAVQMVAEADGIVLTTPIYKASFTGLLKCFLDLLPQFALTGKAVLPLATAGSLAHALALDYSLRPVLQSMGARHVVQGLLVVPAQTVGTQESSLKLEGRTERMLQHAVDHFTFAVLTDLKSPSFGHPNPDTIVAGG